MEFAIIRPQKDWLEIHWTAMGFVLNSMSPSSQNLQPLLQRYPDESSFYSIVFRKTELNELSDEFAQLFKYDWTEDSSIHFWSISWIIRSDNDDCTIDKNLIFSFFQDFFLKSTIITLLVHPLCYLHTLIHLLSNFLEYICE